MGQTSEGTQFVHDLNELKLKLFGIVVLLMELVEINRELQLDQKHQKEMLGSPS